MEQRVVITGIGILSTLGNSYSEVEKSLRLGRSGIVAHPEWEELGFRSAIGGKIEGVEDLTKASGIPKNKLSCMSRSALYCVLAAKAALDDAKLSIEELNTGRSACIAGSGISCVESVYKGGDLTYQGKINRVSPFTVLRSMASSVSANIANVFGIKGRSYSISSACATSTHNIGHAYELIRAGVLDFALTGGSEEIHELTTGAFSAIRTALSSHFNDSPECASRPFDENRDGFVISGGAGILTLEPLEIARARGATIYGEIIGYGANSDGYNMTHPEPEGAGAAACMLQALDDADISAEDVDYLNAHGTATIVGDRAEMSAVRKVFGESMPYLSSTKSMGGHAIGAAGVHELIHCLAMLNKGFLAPSINIDRLDPEFEGIPIVTETLDEESEVAMSNTFGFGGTNGVMLTRRYQ